MKWNQIKLNTNFLTKKKENANVKSLCWISVCFHRNENQFQTFNCIIILWYYEFLLQEYYLLNSDFYFISVIAQRRIAEQCDDKNKKE